MPHCEAIMTIGVYSLIINSLNHQFVKIGPIPSGAVVLSPPIVAPQAFI
jgi:hypothetical protein